MRNQLSVTRIIPGLLAILILLGLAAGGAHAADAKIGFVDIDKVTSEATFVKEMLSKLERNLDARRQVFETKEAEYNRLRDDYRRKQAVLSEAETDSIQKDTRRLRAEMEEEEYEINKILRKSEDEDMGPAMERILKTVQEVARAEGYALILRGELVLYGEPTVDISDAVVRRLNAETKKTGESDKKVKRAPAVSGN